MCGIFGTLTNRSNRHRTFGRMDLARDALVHRGPDDFGIDLVALEQSYFDLHFGQTRLSIIDLSDGGHQPMTSASGRFKIVFNGEIYNYVELRSQLKSVGHVFRTNSDTEVLLAAWEQWGEESLHFLDGMFAFSVFDISTQTLTCVRDQFGVKPLFIAASSESFEFASETRALLRLRQNAAFVDEAAVGEYLEYGNYDRTDKSFFAGVRQIQPGSLLRVQIRESKLNYSEAVWWDLRKLEPRSWSNHQEAVDAVRETFLSGVRRQLRSDVAVGSALSGGLDSSSIVSAMRYLDPKLEINTFSYVARGTSVSEEPWVDLVNEHVNARSHKVLLTSADLGRDLESMIIAQGEPFGSTSIYAQYKVFESAKKNGVTVTLDGQGADEMFAGYHGYPHARIQSLVENRQLIELSKFVEGWSSWPGRDPKSAFGYIANSLVGDLNLNPQIIKVLKRYVRRESSEQPMLVHRAIYEGLTSAANAGSGRRSSPGFRGRRLTEELIGALGSAGVTQLLRHADRNAMAWSVESRVPFLNPDLAKLAMSLPEAWLISIRGETKSIFRAAMRGIVPDKVLDRRDKVGFETPEKSWLYELAPRIPEWIDGIEDMPVIDASKARKHISMVIEGARPFDWSLWRVINYAVWYRQMVIGSPKP